MSHAARSIAVFSVYLFINGLGFLAIPNSLLPLLDLPPANEPWIRGLGIVITVMALYHAVAAGTELVPFFKATVVGRTFVLVSLVTLYLTGTVPRQLILFGVTDVGFALWTLLALRADGARRPAPA